MKLPSMGSINVISQASGKFCSINLAKYKEKRQNNLKPPTSHWHSQAEDWCKIQLNLFAFLFYNTKPMMAQ